VVRGLEKELKAVGITEANGKYEYESSAPFLLCNAEAEREKKIEIVLAKNALSRVAPPTGVTETDLTFHTWTDPRRVRQRSVQTDFANKRVCVDVTVTGVVTASNLATIQGVSSATTPGVGAARAEKTKVPYIALLGDGFIIRTFAVESNGFFGKQAMHIMEKIAEQATAGGADDEEAVLERKSVYLRRMWQRMSVVLHSAVAGRAEDWIARCGNFPRGGAGVG
jgi:hypothetical protein